VVNNISENNQNVQQHNTIITKLLNKDDPLEIEEFERVFYKAFKNIADPSLEAVFDIDHSQRRIKTLIPYRNQEIMTARFEGSVIAASAVNFNMNAPLQLEKYGFSIDKTEDCICEGLFIFNVQPDLPFMFAFKERLLQYLISQNIRKVYSTCSQKRIRGYRLLGFTDIDMGFFNGQKKYLLTMNLNNPDKSAQ